MGRVKRSSGKEGVRDIETRGSIMRVKTYDGLLSCPECESLFSSPEDLESHIAGYHAAQKSRQVRSKS